VASNYITFLKNPLNWAHPTNSLIAYNIKKNLNLAEGYAVIDFSALFCNANTTILKNY